MIIEIIDISIMIMIYIVSFLSVKLIDFKILSSIIVSSMTKNRHNRYDLVSSIIVCPHPSYHLGGVLNE